MANRARTAQAVRMSSVRDVRDSREPGAQAVRSACVRAVHAPSGPAFGAHGGCVLCRHGAASVRHLAAPLWCVPLWCVHSKQLWCVPLWCVHTRPLRCVPLRRVSSAVQAP